jgi:hypothetical protein
MTRMRKAMAKEGVGLQLAAQEFEAGDKRGM